MATKKGDISYAEAMQEIEGILAKFRGNQMDVDNLTDEVKRAIKLIEMCKKRLMKVDEEVKKILEA